MAKNILAQKTENTTRQCRVATPALAIYSSLITNNDLSL